MKVRTITYAMLRKGRDFENDRAEVTVELGEKDAVDAAFSLAKRECIVALNNGCGCACRDRKPY